MGFSWRLVGVALPLVAMAEFVLAEDIPELHRAVKAGSLSDVQRLVSSGTPVDLQDYEGATALYYAAFLDKKKIAEFLLGNKPKEKHNDKPVIIVAIIVQGLIAKASEVAGAIVGYVITTGILVWGLSLYSEGDQIALFGIPLSQPIFIMAILVWYGFDTKEFITAKNVPDQEADQESPPLPQA